MTPNAQRWFTRIARVLTLLYMVGIVYLSLMPGERVPLQGVSDKYRHAAAYGVFAVLIGCCFLRLRLRSAVFAFVWAALFGILIEVIQPHFHRSGDPLDALANAIGAGVGCSLLAIAVLTLRRNPRTSHG